jgi:murein DD-endopeptidase MepM/ murein hydrolase activator NlpD
MRSFAVLVALSAAAQTFDIQPSAAKQGDVIRLSTNAPAVSAKMQERTVRLFSEPDGTRAGLLPVPATTKPGAYQVEFLDEQGQVLRSAGVTVRDARFPEQNVTLSPRVQALKPAPGEMETVAAFRKAVTDTRYWTEPFERPLPGCMTSPFGVRRLHNGKRTGGYHGGIDQRGSAGSPIRAIADGVVAIVRPYNIHGKVVGIDHGQGVASLYLHMSKFATKEGAKIGKGDVIGYVGSTGRSTAPHLHWSISVNGVAVNPEQFVPLSPCPEPASTRKGNRHRGSRHQKAR